MDFTGTWKLRNGKDAIVVGKDNSTNHFFGTLRNNDLITLFWDENGNNLHDGLEYDIMERLSGWARK